MSESFERVCALSAAPLPSASPLSFPLAAECQVWHLARLAALPSAAALEAAAAASAGEARRAGGSEAGPAHLDSGHEVC